MFFHLRPFESFPSWTLPLSGQPRKIVLAVDVSGSMSYDEWPLMVAGCAQILWALPDGSEIAAVVFNDEAKVLVPLTKLDDAVRHRLIDQVANLRPYGGTDILAGLDQALDLLASGGIVICLSDGVDGGQSLSGLSSWTRTLCIGFRSDRYSVDHATATRARQQRVTIYSVGLGSHADSSLLSSLAQETGGKYFAAHDFRGLLNLFAEIGELFGSNRHQSRQGEFDVTTSENLVVASESSGGCFFMLHQLSGKLPVAIKPVSEIERGGIRVCRFRLTPGTYRFFSFGLRSDFLRAPCPCQGPKVVLALDMSGSMAESQCLPLMLVGLTRLLLVLPDDSEVGIVTFNHEANVLVPMTRLDDAARFRLIHQVSGLRPDGNTCITAGVTRALDLLPSGGTVVCLSDGRQANIRSFLWFHDPFAGRHSHVGSDWAVTSEVTARARERGVTIHSVGLGTDADAAVLSQLAKDTDGQCLLVPDFSGVLDQLGRIGALLESDWWEHYNQGPSIVITDIDGIGQPECIVLHVDNLMGENRERFRIGSNLGHLPSPPSLLPVDAASVVEGDSGCVNAVFTIQLAAWSHQPATVQCSRADGSATAGFNYTATKGALTFAPGEPTKTILVPILGDRVPGDNEDFFVNLSCPSNAAVRKGQGVGTMLESDRQESRPRKVKAEAHESPVSTSKTFEFAFDWGSGKSSLLTALARLSFPEVTDKVVRKHRMNPLLRIITAVSCGLHLDREPGRSFPGMLEPFSPGLLLSCEFIERRTVCPQRHYHPQLWPMKRRRCQPRNPPWRAIKHPGTIRHCQSPELASIQTM